MEVESILLRPGPTVTMELTCQEIMGAKSCASACTSATADQHCRRDRSGELPSGPPRLPGRGARANTLYACADSGQNLIKEDIKKYNLNRVVVSACSVRMHEPTFRGAVAEAGLNPFLMEMANIREQCTWAHGHDQRRRAAKAKDLTAAAVAKASSSRPGDDQGAGHQDGPWSSAAVWPASAPPSTWATRVLRPFWWRKNRPSAGSMAQLNKTFPTMDCSI